jgi:CMP-N-acetylneuraminic acid synthetase
MENLRNTRYDMVVLLQPTCPIRKSSHIDEAVDLLWRSELPTLASVKGPFKKRDPNLKKISNGALVDYCGTEVSGDWEPFYIYNASIYAAKRGYLVTERKLVSATQVPLVMDAVYSADVDTMADVYVVEAFMKHLRGQGKEDSNA